MRDFARSVLFIASCSALTGVMGCGPEPVEGDTQTTPTTPQTPMNNTSSGASCEEVCAAIEALCGPVVDECAAMCEAIYAPPERDCLVAQSSCQALEQCEQTSSNNTTPGNQTSGALVNGVPASQFYGDFTWEQSDGRFSSGAAEFDEQPDGANMFQVRLFLFEDGSANVFYEEGSGEVSFDGFYIEPDENTRARVDTSWSIEGTSLRIGDLFTCSGSSSNDRPTISCKLERAVGVSAAVEEVARLGISAQGSPNDPEFASYSPE